MNFNISNRRHSHGQGMTEYIIIVAVIALAAVGTYSYFGKSIRNQTAALASGLAGDKKGATDATNAAKEAADGAQKEGTEKRGLNNFHEGVEGL